MYGDGHADARVVTFAYAPVPVCRRPLATVGLGDAISASGLLASLDPRATFGGPAGQAESPEAAARRAWRTPGALDDDAPLSPALAALLRDETGARREDL
jgi:hypothetical protein